MQKLELKSIATQTREAAEDSEIPNKPRNNMMKVRSLVSCRPWLTVLPLGK
jgi:hypothetical protein